MVNEILKIWEHKQMRAIIDHHKAYTNLLEKFPKYKNIVKIHCSNLMFQ